jgi:hypothetical protein
MSSTGNPRMSLCTLLVSMQVPVCALLPLDTLGCERRNKHLCAIRFKSHKVVWVQPEKNGIDRPPTPLQPIVYAHRNRPFGCKLSSMARTAKHISEPNSFVNDWQPQISSTKSLGERHCDVSRQRTCRAYHNGLKIGDGQWR